MSDPIGADNRTYTIERTFNAPITLVWEAWTQAEHIVKWWGPNGMKTEVVEHDFTVGGKWNYKMAMPNGQDFIAHGQYLAIEAPTKVATTANFIPMTTGVEMHASFADAGAQTHFTFTVVHDTEEYRDQQLNMGANKGWGSTFDRLEEYLASQA